MGRAEMSPAPASAPPTYVAPEFVAEVVAGVERGDQTGSRAGAVRALRRLGLDDFGGLLLSMPDPKYPKLSAVLPAMAAADVQVRWTGSSGVTLLKQTLDFVRSVSYAFASLTGRSLSNATVLDFGCGYGRIARLMYYFVDEGSYFGVDPWQASIDLCRGAGLTTNFLLSDYLPTELPVGDVRFDLMYAFSVFTHLSERATLSAMRVLRKYVKPDGLLVVTIRPIEYWRHDTAVSAAEAEALEARHRQVGFAFRPHDRPAVDGDVTYGDTSMTLAWLADHCPEWKLGGIDRSLEDPFQIYVFLVPA